MARKDEDVELSYYVPKNFTEKSVTITGLSYRNIIEAAIIVGIIVAILWFIPNDAISVKTKIAIGIIAGVPLGGLGVIGINQCSLSEYLINIISFKLNPRIYVRKELYQKK